MGSHSQYVVSGSDDGHIFVWDRGTGELANLLRSSDSGVSCVAPHPHLPMLASCGHDPIVRLWSPEVCLPSCPHPPLHVNAWLQQTDKQLSLNAAASAFTSISATSDTSLL